jgi:mono/diheme cytochrome c family protein
MRSVSHFSKLLIALALSASCLFVAGCEHYHGEPGAGPEVPRPEEVRDFSTLYKENCAACHGTNGKGGAAISLANPVYLGIVDESVLHDVTAKGLPGTLMPPFGKSSGGMLTDEQVNILAHGILQQWSKPALFAGQTPPSYHATLSGDATRGQQAFVSTCARCHGVNGEGRESGDTAKSTYAKPGSIVDPSYLALISDQGLRSTIIGGRPEDGMPDWRSYTTQPLTDQQISDIVAWIVSKRINNPGQPYKAQP